MASTPSFIIALNFGLTDTAVAYHRNGSTEDIYTVQCWPGREELYVPSEVFVSTSGYDWDWGYNANYSSRSPSEWHCFRHLRRELEDPQDAKTELQSLSGEVHELMAYLQQGGDGRQQDLPARLARPREGLVDYYLAEVAKHVREDMASSFHETALLLVPINLVVPYPSMWPDRCKRRLFRAIESAFSRDLFPTLQGIYFVKDAEAIASYIMRDMDLSGQILTSSAESSLTDSFVLLDIGDYVATAVPYSYSWDDKTAVVDHKYISRARCGSSVVDDEFLHRYLPSRFHIEHNLFWKLFGSSEEIRNSILPRFENIRNAFKGDGPALADLLDLPQKLVEQMAKSGFAADGTADGSIIIPGDDFRRIFKPCVDAAISLVQKQVETAALRRRRIRTVFLTGSIARSEYLLTVLRDSLQRWDIEVTNALDSTTVAVARGAVMMGLGLGNPLHGPVRRTRFHHGVSLVRCDAGPVPGAEGVVVNHINWLVDQGNPIFPDDGRTETAEFSLPFERKDREQGLGAVFAVVRCSSDSRPSRMADTDPARTHVTHLPLLLSDIPTDAPGACERLYMPPKGRLGRGLLYFRGRLCVNIHVGEGDELHCSIACGGQTLTEKWVQPLGSTDVAEREDSDGSDGADSVRLGATASDIAEDSDFSR